MTPAANALPDDTGRGVWASAGPNLDYTDQAGNIIVALPIANGRSDICAASIQALSTGSA